MPYGRTWNVMCELSPVKEQDGTVAVVKICSDELSGISTNAETEAFNTIQKLLDRYVDSDIDFPQSKYNVKANNINTQ